MIKTADNGEIALLINRFPGIQNVICRGEKDFTLVYIDGDEVVGFLSAFIRDIPAPLDGKTECFINVIDVFSLDMRGKGIGSALVQEAIHIAKERNAIQVRAYCDINNVPSHMLWLKNKFGISPVKMQDGSISGSYVTYRIG